MSTETSDYRSPLSRWEAILLAVLLSAVAFYHYATIHRQSLFVDEANEVTHAQAPWSEIAAIPDSMPPLFTYLLKAWVFILGVDSARWLSAIFGMATIVATWWIVRRMVDRNVAAISAVLLAFSPFVLYYSQLVRAYAMFMFLAVLAIGGIAVASRGKSYLHWGVLAVVCAAGMWTHYYFAFVLLPLAVIALATDAPRLWRPLLATGIAVVVLAGPIVYSLKSDFAFQHDLRDPRPLSVAAAAYTYVSFFSGYTVGPSKPELQAMSITDAIKSIAPWAIAIAACGIALAAFGFRRLARHRLRVAVVSLFVVPVLLVGVIGWATGITYNVRFVAWCVVPLAVLAAAGVVEGWQKWIVKMATVGLICISLVAIYNRTYVPRYQNEDLRAAAAYVEQAGGQQPVFIVSDYLTRAFNVYYPTPTHVIELPLRGESGHAVKSLADATASADAIESEIRGRGELYWLVYARPFHGDPNGDLLDLLYQQHGLEQQAHFAGVRVFRGSIQEPTPSNNVQ